MKNSQRVKTHIPGFDELVQGGFPQSSNILLSGSAGTGKTIFSLQYLYNGAVLEKEAGIYFTFEERGAALREQAQQFGWDLEKLEKKKLLRIIPIGVEELSKSTLMDIIEIVRDTKSKRVVIDSITTLAYLSPMGFEETSPTLYSVKKFLYKFMALFKEFNGATSIFISQKDEEISNSIAEYLCDGIVTLNFETLGGDCSRSLLVKKMRRTKNDEDLHPLEINDSGVHIRNL